MNLGYLLRDGFFKAKQRLRIGTARRPPRGVTCKVPIFAPSLKLLGWDIWTENMEEEDEDQSSFNRKSTLSWPIVVLLGISLLRALESSNIQTTQPPFIEWAVNLDGQTSCRTIPGVAMTSEDTWKLATGDDDGKPLIFRIRNSHPSFARKKNFPYLLAMSWQYEPANESGMPSEEVVARMSELEDLLMEAFEGAREAFLSVIATGNGVREWQWYARNPDDVMGLVNETLGELEPFPVEFSLQSDPEWEGYSRFLDLD